MSEYTEADFKEFYGSNDDNSYRNDTMMDGEAGKYMSSGGKRYRKKSTKRRYGGFAPLPIYGGFNRAPLYGGQPLSSPIPTGGKSRKGRKSRKSRKSKKSRKGRKSRKSRKH